ncbi:MAG: hypothetical protein AUI53_04200 [Acidobacteria bacterium 13_1_40CM_2_60_7]|nr:MAG: hypothetical protein AUI53_04200 [Acidobacteria bacterium 13_1_40CM_2_60_7]OLE84852.1 MAG: hypothetical protein AUG07_05700 [Acidobacteria bacterium 13_1_20CM_2_60_10]
MIRIGGLVLVYLTLAPLCAAQAPERVGSGSAVTLPGRSNTPALSQIEESFRAGRFREAQTDAQELVKAQPDNARAWMFLGMASVRLNEAAKAVQAFEKAIALDPTDSRPYFDLGLLYASQNDLDKAIDRYQKGLALDDRNGATYYNYGRVLLAKGRIQEAVDALRRDLALNPSDSEARIAVVEALLRAHERKKAREEVHAVLEKNDAPGTVLVSLGGLLVRGGEFDLGKTVLTRALAVSPDSAAAHIELSRLSTALSYHTEAIHDARRAVQLAPDSLETNLALAEALISARQDRLATELLKKLEPRFGGTGAFHYTLGIAEYRAGRYQPAVTAFERAIQLDPNLDLAFFLLGQTHLVGGELDPAEACFKSAVRLKPDSTLYYNYLARVYEQKGSPFHDAAVQATERVLALDPKDVESRERMAKWAKEAGDLARARALLEEVVADAPTEISVRVLLASIYYRLNLRQKGDEQTGMVRRLEALSQESQTKAH